MTRKAKIILFSLLGSGLAILIFGTVLTVFLCTRSHTKATPKTPTHAAKSSSSSERTTADDDDDDQATPKHEEKTLTISKSDFAADVTLKADDDRIKNMEMIIYVDLSNRGLDTKNLTDDQWQMVTDKMKEELQKNLSGTKTDGLTYDVTHENSKIKMAIAFDFHTMSPNDFSKIISKMFGDSEKSSMKNFQIADMSLTEAVKDLKREGFKEK